MLPPTAELPDPGEPWSSRVKRVLPGQVARAPPNAPPNVAHRVVGLDALGNSFVSHAHEGSSVWTRISFR